MEKCESFPIRHYRFFHRARINEKIYGKDYVPKENEANILKVNREDFNSFYLSKGARVPEAVSSNKLFLSGFITEVRNSEKNCFQ